MPVFDWTRSRLDQELPDGSNALVYCREDVDKMDPTKMTLPGWDASYTPDEMSGLIEKYKEIGEEGLWKNLEYFIKEIIEQIVVEEHLCSKEGTACIYLFFEIEDVLPLIGAFGMYFGIAGTADAKVRSAFFKFPY